jgi:DNA-directed RNA polymerase specialized sigma24 family protein
MAFLLCGDWHTAEDLAQTALAKVFVSWRKIRRQDAVHAYATRRWSTPTWPISA